MLSSLKIENVAVIEKAQAQFTAGLNVLTGETGAGKSILIDSINAILGNRTSRDLVRTGGIDERRVGRGRRYDKVEVRTADVLGRYVPMELDDSNARLAEGLKKMLEGRHERAQVRFGRKRVDETDRYVVGGSRLREIVVRCGSTSFNGNGHFRIFCVCTAGVARENECEHAARPCGEALQ